MNLSVAKDQLIHGLQSVQNIVSTRTTLPILSNVLLKDRGKQIGIHGDRPGRHDCLFGGGERQEKGGQHRAGQEVFRSRPGVEQP